MSREKSRYRTLSRRELTDRIYQLETELEDARHNMFRRFENMQLEIERVERLNANKTPVLCDGKTCDMPSH